MTILTLALKAEYFDAIKAGTKLFEYRAQTEYWRKRIEGRQFDKVVFTRGYPARSEASLRIERPWSGYE